MAAFQSLEDIHPITLQQLLYLSQCSDKFKMTLKLKGKESLYAELNSDKVKLVERGF